MHGGQQGYLSRSAAGSQPRTSVWIYRFYDPDAGAPGGFRLPFNLETGDLIAARWKQWQKHDPIHMVQHHKANLKSLRAIYIDCGWRDQYHLHYGTRILSRCLAEAGIDPSALIFELTETAAIANLEDAQRFAHRLRGLGCRFALDDFGSGCASFHYLKTLPFDYIKIDGGFIRDLPRQPVDRLVVRAIVAIAKGMGKQTIAEFVTDQSTCDLLAEEGVYQAQGFHVGRPQPAADVFAHARAEGVAPHAAAEALAQARISRALAERQADADVPTP